MADSGNDLLSPAEVADIVGCSKVYICRLINAGKLPARKVGRSWAIARKDAAEIEVTTRARIHQAKKAAKITKKRR
jgi:excisionase family DNA binding protein